MLKYGKLALLDELSGSAGQVSLRPASTPGEDVVIPPAPGATPVPSGGPSPGVVASDLRPATVPIGPGSAEHAAIRDGDDRTATATAPSSSTSARRRRRRRHAAHARDRDRPPMTTPLAPTLTVSAAPEGPTTAQ